MKQTIAGTVILFTKRNDGGKCVPTPIIIGGSSEGGEISVLSGKSSTKFDPKGTCTRAQIVTFLYRASLFK